jgi:uncharacterized NAD(P)/FAD-binding protein YdhS
MRAGRKYVSNPWVNDPFRGLNGDDPIIVIGSGLTAVDLLVEAESRKAAGKIIAISRHGLIPQAHSQAMAKAAPNITSPSRPTTRSLLHVVRTAIQQVEELGGDWRSVIDSLRPGLQELWKSLNEIDKRRFLRHVAAYWEVHRHRVAPEIHRMVDNATKEGRFAVIAGRIKCMIEHEHEIEVVVKRRGSETHETLRVQRVINCTGPSRDLYVGFPSLVRALCDRGLGRPDPLGLGLQVGANAALMGDCGSRSKRIFAIGPLLKGELWETTAVRELRVQAADLARHLASILEVSSKMTVPRPRLNLASSVARTLGKNFGKPPARNRSAT